MTLVIAVLAMWWRDAVVERVKWHVQDLRGNDTSAWGKVDTGEWLAPARKKLGSSK